MKPLVSINIDKNNAIPLYQVAHLYVNALMGGLPLGTAFVRHRLILLLHMVAVLVGVLGIICFIFYEASVPQWLACLCCLLPSGKELFVRGLGHVLGYIEYSRLTAGI
jgi:hypothetical protein